jgi:hypothetical protein
MLLVSPCAVVVCGPRWALPQSVVRSRYSDRMPDISIFDGAGFPAVPSVVVKCPTPDGWTGY